MNEKLGDLEITDLETNLETDLETWQSDYKRGHTVLKFLLGRVVRGLKWGVFYTFKYSASVAQNLE